MEEKKYEKPTIKVIVVEENIVLNSGEIDYGDLEGDPD